MALSEPHYTCRESQVYVLEQLYREIDRLKETLCAFDSGDTSMDNAQQLIEEHRKKISGILATYAQADCNLKPIHRLLSVRPLTRVQIPLDILEMLQMFGYDVNKMNRDGFPCLTIAIRNSHYAAVRWLVDHGADCNLRNENKIGYFQRFCVGAGKSPVAWLASYSNVPLDLFDILKTSENLNNSSRKELPLHTSVWRGLTENALCLIELGANIMQTDGFGQLPINYYIYIYTETYDAELFTSLMSSCSRYLLRIICVLLIETRAVQDYDVILKMLQQLLQRLILDQPISFMIHIETESDSDIEDDITNEYIMLDIKLNQDDVYSGVISVQSLYLLSLLLFHLDCDISFPETFKPHVQHSESSKEILTYTQAVDDIWKTHNKKSGVRSLLSLCIQQIRQSMNSLSDSSFLTLPVPSHICKMLMNQDIADVICEAWRLWPQCLPRDNYS